MSGTGVTEWLVRTPIRRVRSLFSRDRGTAWDLQAKILMFACGLVVAMTAGQLLIGTFISHRQAERRSADAMLDMAAGFARMMAADAAPVSGLGTSLAVQIVNLSPRVNDAYVLDREGRIVAEAHESDQPNAGRALRDPPVLRTIIDRKAAVFVEKWDVTAAAPIVDPRGDVTGYVVLRGMTDPNPQTVDTALLGAAMFLTLGALLATWFSLMLTRPLKALSSAAARIARDDFGRPVSVDTRDEFRTLADSLNRMMARTASSRAAYERAQRDLAKAADRAEAASRAKSEFLAGMSHELRTPLNAIIGFSDLLIGVRSSGLPEAKRREYARDINRAGRHLLTLVCGILEYAQMDAGGVELLEAPADIAEMVQSVVSSFDSLADDNGVMLSAAVAPGLPMLRCDGERLSQAIGHLVSNAVQFTRSGGYVTVTLARCDRGGLVLRIADNGVGIDESDIERALLPFGRLGRHAVQRAGGIGLGLPLARKLIELHDGAFRIESYPNVGTVVTVRLPAERIVEPRTSAVA